MAQVQSSCILPAPLLPIAADMKHPLCVLQVLVCLAWGLTSEWLSPHERSRRSALVLLVAASKQGTGSARGLFPAEAGKTSQSNGKVSHDSGKAWLLHCLPMEMCAEHLEGCNIGMYAQGAGASISSAPLSIQEGWRREHFLMERKEPSLMSLSTLLRWSGLVALVGFPLLAVVSVAFVFAFPEAQSVTVTSNTWLVLNVLILMAYLLCQVGLIGLYARQAEKAGILGLVAFLLTFFCIAPRFAWYWIETFIFPILAQAAPRLLDNQEPVPPALNVFGAVDQISVLLLIVGVLLFGVASLRARVLPRWAAVLVLVGAVLDLVMTFVGVDFPFAAVVAGAGLAWMGYAVWASKQMPSASLAPVTAGGPSLASD